MRDITELKETIEYNVNENVREAIMDWGIKRVIDLIGVGEIMKYMDLKELMKHMDTNQLMENMDIIIDKIGTDKLERILQERKKMIK